MIALFAAALLAAAPSPADALKHAEAGVRAALKPGAPEAALRKAVDGAFDYEELAKRSLGPAWDKASKAEREKVATLLQQVIEANYLPKVKGAGSYTFTVGEAKREGDTASVQARAAAGGEGIPLEFRMKLDGARWRVYDTVIDGVGLVDTYSEQFDRVMAKGGMPALIGALQKRLDVMKGAK